MNVLRLCSVFEPPDASVVERAGFDPVGGMQNHTANLTRELDRRGVAQTVVTSRLGGSTGIWSCGAHSHVVRVGLPVRRLRQFWAALAVPTVLRSRPELVHVHQGEDFAVIPLGVAAARHFRCPLVLTLHTSLRVSVPAADARLAVLHTLGGAIESVGLRRADAVIALTETTARRLPVAATVIPSGVADADPTGASPLLTCLPAPRIVYVGRLAAQKDVGTLVRAFGRLRTNASLAIVGDGPERATVERAVAALPDPVRGRVRMVGFRPHDEVAAILAAADVLVLPSIYEEMGSVLAEALQAGVPVVASRVGGIPDVVQDGGTGLLVPPRDVDGFAAAIDELLTDPVARARMRAAALERAGAYHWPELAERVLDVYRSATARRFSSDSLAAVRSMV